MSLWSDYNFGATYFHFGATVLLLTGYFLHDFGVFPRVQSSRLHHNHRRPLSQDPVPVVRVVGLSVYVPFGGVSGARFSSSALSLPSAGACRGANSETRYLRPVWCQFVLSIDLDTAEACGKPHPRNTSSRSTYTARRQ